MPEKTAQPAQTQKPEPPQKPSAGPPAGEATNETENEQLKGHVAAAILAIEERIKKEQETCGTDCTQCVHAKEDSPPF